MTVKPLPPPKLAKYWTSHDREIFDFYSQFIVPGDLVFDIGANIGNRTKIFLALGANVVAVEPQDDCVNYLKKIYGRSKHLAIFQMVLGAFEGKAELMISNANTISSLSLEWIEAVKSSGRFSGYTWKDKKIVPMTTLDQLIDFYKLPSFIKIDVEGFEHQVMRGLSRQVSNISFEFTPEFIHSSLKCFEHLKTLGNVLFNYSVGESMRLALDNYVTSDEIARILKGFRHDNILFGDVYCKFI